MRNPLDHLYGSAAPGDGGAPVGAWWHRRNLGRAALRSLPIVAISYTAAVLSTTRGLTSAAPTPVDGGTSFPAAGALLFTFSHGLLASLFYVPFMRAIRANRRSMGGPGGGIFSGFVHIHMGLWFGVPLLLLAGLAGWWVLLPVVLHVAAGPGGTRRWTFIQHGSTALALVLYSSAVGGFRATAAGILLLAGQVILLTVMDVAIRPLWIPPPRPSPAAGSLRPQDLDAAGNVRDP